MGAVTARQITPTRLVLSLLAIAVGLFGVVRFWPDDGDSSRPAEVVTTSTSIALSSTSTTVATSRTTRPGDELQAAINAFKAAAADDPGDAYGTADGVHRDPDGGRWAEVNRDTSCSWSIVDYDGTVVDSGRGDVVIVPAQVAEFRTEPRCAWAYLPEP